MDSKAIEWLIKHLEDETNERIKCERLLLEIMRMPWYKRIFVRKKIYKFFGNKLDI